jgi:hypothetical protein
MMQQGRVFALATRGRDGKRHWAFRYRTAGRASKRVQRGGFRSEEDARAALARALEKLRRERGWRGGPTSPSSRSPADTSGRLAGAMGSRITGSSWPRRSRSSFRPLR